MLYVYCIRGADDAAPPVELHGIDGAPVNRAAEGKLALWTSPLAAPAPTVERIRDHNRVVATALRTATPLPLRFGTAFADVEAARAAMREHQAAWAASLSRVAGQVEMGILVLWDRAAEERRLNIDPPNAAPPTSGRDYLNRRRTDSAREQALGVRAEFLLDRVDDALAALASAKARRLLPTPDAAGSVAHLVHRETLDRYRQTFANARVDAETRLVLSGPWAPYSFV